MEQIASLLHLGGYGAYVWPAYGIAATVLIGGLWHSLACLRANERLVARLQSPSTASGSQTSATDASRSGAEPG